MGTPPSFFLAMFLKGDNFRDFLFSFLDDEVLLKWGLLLMNEFTPMGTSSFFYEITTV